MTPPTTRGKGYRVEWRDFRACFETPPPVDRRSMYRMCEKAFGLGVHVAGELSPSRCLVVMRSESEDDTSKPWLEAMRKAATQLSGNRPGFIVVQFQDVATEDLLLRHLRRRAGILSYALYGHYGADHVNATQVCGNGAVVPGTEDAGTPAFSVPNPKPRFPLNPSLALPFLGGSATRNSPTR